MSKFEKIKALTSLVGAECRRDPKYVICFLGAAIVRLMAVLFSTFLLLWITSFVDDGIIATEQESKTLYQKVILASTIATIFLLPILGHLGDKVPSAVIIPIAFTLRGLCGLSFMWMNDPQSVISMTLCCLLIIMTVVESVSIEVLFMRGMPRAIRGTMASVMAFFGLLGTLVFTLVGGQLFDRIDKSAPFVFLASMDFLLVIIAMGLISTGNF